MSEFVSKCCHQVDRVVDSLPLPREVRSFVRPGAVWFGGSLVAGAVGFGLTALGVSSGTMIPFIAGAAMSQLAMRTAKPYLPKEWQHDAQRAINFGVVATITGGIGQLAVSGISFAIPSIAAMGAERLGQLSAGIGLSLLGIWYFGPDAAKKAKELYPGCFSQPTVE